jgi:predicted Zn-dependent protease
MVSIGLFFILSTLGLDMHFTSVLQKYLMDLPNSRTQEREADLIGLRLMSRACYNPEAAPEMFSRLGQLESKMGKSGPDFFQTHPSSESRVKLLEEALPQGYAILAANPDCDRLRDEMQSFRDSAHMMKFARNGIHLL